MLTSLKWALTLIIGCEVVWKFMHTVTEAVIGYCYRKALKNYKNPWPCKKIRLIEGNAKCRHLAKFTSKGTLRQVFICRRTRILYPPPFTHCIRVYSILIHIGKGGNSRTKREG